MNIITFRRKIHAFTNRDRNKIQFLLHALVLFGLWAEMLFKLHYFSWTFIHDGIWYELRGDAVLRCWARHFSLSLSSVERTQTY